MNRRLLLGAGGIIIIGLVVIAFGLRENGWFRSYFQKSEISKDAVLRTPEVEEAKIEEETPQYKIDVSYPQFHNLGDPNREAAANNLIKEKIEKSTAAFRDAIREATDTFSTTKSELLVSYKVVNLNSSIASILVSEYTYVEGAVHPLGLSSPFNYNFRDNREISLADPFNPGSNYLSVLSDISRASLKRQLKESYIQESVEFGTEPRPENFSVFFLDKDKFVVVFNVYQVIGYAAGSQTVEIPYEQLSGILRQEWLELIRQ